MEVIEIQKSYGKKKILKNISFKTEAGKCIGIIGANGCGKSTLFRILSGVEKADGGSVMVNGRKLVFGKEKLTELIGYVPQENALWEDLSVQDNLKLFASLGTKMADKEYTDMLCWQFSVADFRKEKVGRLSGGMKKRVSIVCALINRPQILIMDEPDSSLDLVFKEELKCYIKGFISGGGTVLVSSHDRDGIENCDVLYAIRDGVMVPVDRTLSMEEMIVKYMQQKNKGEA